MKYITLILLLVSVKSFSQSLTYYNTDNNSFKAITVVIPPLNNNAGKMFYNSSSSKEVEEIHQIKDVSNKDAQASLVNIGSDKTQYIIVATKDAQHLVLSDLKGLFITTFDLDSKKLSVNQSAPANDFAPTAKTLVSIFKYLLL